MVVKTIAIVFVAMAVMLLTEGAGSFRTSRTNVAEASSNAARTNAGATADIVNIETIVWQSRTREEILYLSARQEPGSWATLGTVPLDMSGTDEEGTHRYGGVTLSVTSSDGATTDVEIRVWQQISDPGSLLIGARPEDAHWLLVERTRVELSDTSGNETYRAGQVTLAVTLPGDPAAAREDTFDMTRGNAMRDVVFPRIAEWIEQDISPATNDASLIFRYYTLLLNASFDAVAPYHESAVGVYSRLGRRPAAESATNLRPNIAVMYSVYRSMLAYAPERSDEWRALMADHGLDPDNGSGLNHSCATRNARTPAAIGNLAARCVIDARRNDGFNHFGNETPGYPFGNSSGYVPVNTAYELTDPSRWQPLVNRRGGVYTVQQFVTPQWANTEPYSGINPREYRVEAPLDSNYANMEAYRAQADEVLDISANLTDEQKVLIEFFDNKLRGRVLTPEDKYIDDVILFVQLDFMLHMARFDGGIVTWQEKARYDAVRPLSAIRHLYGDELVTAWGGPGKGTIGLPANQWQTFTPNADHPEYPSATTCFCAAYAQGFRRFNEDYRTVPTDQPIEFQGVRAAGSSVYEPGIAPLTPITLSFETWTEYETTCGQSRVWSGVHFQPSVDASLDMCSTFGDTAYDYWTTLLDGTAPLREAAVRLDPDPLMQEDWTAQ